jgi:type IV secretory pathway VirB10-like protein
MHGRQLAPYVACLVVFVACVAEAYDALFPSPSATPQEAAAGPANIAAPRPPDASNAAVPPFSVARSNEHVPAPPNPAAEQGASRAAEQRDPSEAPFATIGKSEPQSDERSPPRAEEALTNADRQGREDNAGDGHRNRYQVRTVRRGVYYNRGENRGEFSFFGRERYDTSARRDYTYGRREYYDNYARRDSGAFVRGNDDRFRSRQGTRADNKNSGSRQSRGIFGTFGWH